MTKNGFIAITMCLALHSIIIAGNNLLTGKVSEFSQQGIGTFSIHIVSFLASCALVVTIKQKIWRFGGILAAMSMLSRSSSTFFPEQKVIFLILTIVLGICSLIFLASSWKFETFNLEWWERKI